MNDIPFESILSDSLLGSWLYQIRVVSNGWTGKEGGKNKDKKRREERQELSQKACTDRRCINISNAN
jgi:hypothetical protein